MRFGPGPVFFLELVAAGRRWQHFALRTGFVMSLLVALGVVWINDARSNRRGTQFTNADHADLGRNFAVAVLGTQLALVLLAAPAATAGAICIDKARGNLMLLMTTDLTAREIVLGKLAARLWPVLVLIAASLPVLFIASLLGGITGEMLSGGFAILVSTACLCCALAFLISVYVGKTHEALLLTYMLIGVWLLAFPVLDMVGLRAYRLPAANPFIVLLEPMTSRVWITGTAQTWFSIVTLSVAVAFTAMASWRLRPVALRQAGTVGAKRRGSRLGRRNQSLLDRKPLAWYERHRSRPSKAAALVWGIYIVACLAGLVWLFLARLPQFRQRDMAPLVNVFGVGIGLLLATVTAVVSLADERSRGSLDILLTTPVSSRSIVRAKWWNAYKIVLGVAVIPALVGLICMVGWNQVHEFSWFAIVAAMVVHPLASGAMFTSLGLLLAARMTHFGRAVGVAVALFVLLTVGWMFGVIFIARTPNDGAIAMIVASPVYAAGQLAALLESGRGSRERVALWFSFVWATLFAAVAYGLYSMVARRFDRWMGRIPDTGTRRSVPPQDER